ncbi:MAG: sensor histidine kinase [Solirubrobacterales bacterium]
MSGKPKPRLNAKIIHVDIGTLEEIVDQVVSTVENARTEIYDIADEARKEYEGLAADLFALKEEARAIIAEVEKCERAERQARQRLVEVSRNFKSTSEDEIKAAYDTASQLQVRLASLREQEKSLLRRRDDLERSLKRVSDIAHRAEGLMEQVNMAVRMLKGNFEQITEQLGDIAKRQNLALWMIQAQEEERKKIARELHDGPAQGLASLIMRMDWIDRIWDQDREKARQEMNQLKAMARENINEVRRVIFDLRPVSLDELGLVPALRDYLGEYEAKHALAVHFQLVGQERRLESTLEVALFRLVQEALTNVKKHAGVTEATVKLETSPEMVTVIIRDEGQGFDPEVIHKQRGHYGIIGMKERVEFFGGEIKVNSKPGHGVQVTIKLPLAQGGNA